MKLGARLDSLGQCVKLWLRLREQYQAVIQSQTKHCTITDVIAQTARHETIPITASL